MARGYNLSVNWIFLSPHFDDIALSCGGLLWELSQSGQAVEICTICSSAPPEGPLSSFAESLHTRWETGAQAVSTRKMEDQVSCTALGATWRYIEIPDCIYRPGGSSGLYFYATEESLFGSLHPEESTLVSEVAARIRTTLDPGDQIVAPLALGGHVDHQLTRQAAEQLKVPILYYGDYPYLLHESARLSALAANGWQVSHFPISSSGLSAWQSAITAHTSQISTFWSDVESMQSAIRALWEVNKQGISLWSPDKLVYTT